MKKIVLQVYARLVAYYFLLKLHRLTRNGSRGQRVILVDIDNTLADTWPTLKAHVYPSEVTRYRSLPTFIGMRNHVEKLLNDPANRVFFLSARDARYYKATLQWLDSIGLGEKRAALFLVMLPQDKLLFIKKLLRKDFKVSVIDDLSHSHEKGSVKLYDDIIREILNLQVHFTGHEGIGVINARHE